MAAEDNALYYGDCLTWMEEWLPDARHSVDLIYLDPPFNSNTNYNILFGRGNGVSAQMRGFTDTWRWDAAAAERQARLEDASRHPVHEVARALRALLGESGMLAYLTYLGERLAVMRDLLKPNGALYLHCDDTASHYLRILLDAIFGPQRYRNHIAWRRATSHNDSKRYGRILDHILYYANGDDPYWDGDAIAEPRTEEEISRAYPLTDDRGRYRAAAHLTAAGVTKEGESGRPWKGYDISAAGRHWSPPRTGTYAEYIERELIPGYRSIKGVHARLDALDAAGLIAEPGNGNGNGAGLPALKRYAAGGAPRLSDAEAAGPAGEADHRLLPAGRARARPLLRLRHRRRRRPQPGAALDGHRHLRHRHRAHPRTPPGADGHHAAGARHAPFAGRRAQAGVRTALLL